MAYLHVQNEKINWFLAIMSEKVPIFALFFINIMSNYLI